ncbi:DUF4400 domain-containing protein [Vibrio owensii]|uniref:DUF4400 domain-containing protein n=1 Tax=Vibrio owensii TaxID=696485 RepID=UPI004068B656
MSADPYDSFEKQGNDLILKDREYENRVLYIVCTTIFLTLVYLWIWVQPSDFRDQIYYELNLSSTILTPSQANQVVGRTTDIYNRIMIDTGFEVYLNSLYINEPEPDDRGRRNSIRMKLSAFSERAIENTKLLFYRAILRLNMMWQWFGIATVLIFAFFADAYYQYKLRIIYFRGQNIKIASLSIKMIFVIIVMMYFYIILPITNVTLWRFTPLLFIAMSIVFGTAIIRNYQRM